jgi:hypothetical protein
MKYELMIRSRAVKTDPIAAKHTRFFAELSKIPAPWGIAGAPAPEPPDPGRDLGAGVGISKLLGKGISGRVYYVLRRDFEDLGMHDDFLDMSFNPTKVDYKRLVQDELPKIISAFGAYFAELGDAEFVHIDFDAERQAGMGDTRFGVYRIRPVSFFDKTLCERAFGISPGEIARRLEGSVEQVSLLNDGVYIIGSSEPLGIEDADKLCWEMKRLLTK